MNTPIKCELPSNMTIFILMIKQSDTTRASAAIGTVKGPAFVAATITIALMLYRDADAAGG
jgi:hypothetical protein